MNKQRRTELQQIASKIEELKSLLESVRESEDESFNAMPESFQYGERGQSSQNAIDSLDYAIGSLDDCLESIGSAAE